MKRNEFEVLLSKEQSFFPIGKANRHGPPNNFTYLTIHNTDNRQNAYSGKNEHPIPGKLNTHQFWSCKSLY